MSDASRTDHDTSHDPVAADIDSRNAKTGDIVAGEQVLDVDDPKATSEQRTNAAEERTDAGAAPIQPEAS